MAEGEGKVSCANSVEQYLHSGPDTHHTCWFLIGHTEEGVSELIAGCRLHMMAHSVPLRNMLCNESEIAEEGTKANPVKINDVKPNTFKHFIKYINFNTVPTLSLEEAADLLYVAEKYIVENLKTKLEQHIVPQLNVDSVFLLMTKPACLQNETLKNAIQKICQEKTEQLFVKKEFLELSSSELLSKIVTQDTLSVTELELWKGILRWAKHKAQSEDGDKLRESMSDLLKFIRFCVLDMKDFCKEVVPAGVLTASEVLSINMVFGGKLDCEKSSAICYELSPRNVASSERNIVRGLNFDFVTKGINYDYGTLRSSKMFITTDAKAVQLLCGGFKSPHGYRCAPSNLKLQCNCKVSLTRITDYKKDTSSEKPVHFQFEKDVTYDTEFIMPFAESMKLKPYNKYKLEFQFTPDFPVLCNNAQTNTILTQQGLVVSWWCEDPGFFNFTHLRWFDFKTL